MTDSDCIDLPTIEQAQEFLRLVNVGRAAVGLDPIDTLDFDGAEPGHTVNCLSARNLFAPVAGEHAMFSVGMTAVRGVPSEVVDALGMEEAWPGAEHFDIPDAILAVTDPFDEETPGLRERLVEAGVVA